MSILLWTDFKSQREKTYMNVYRYVCNIYVRVGMYVVWAHAIPYVCVYGFCLFLLCEIYYIFLERFMNIPRRSPSRIPRELNLHYHYQKISLSQIQIFYEWVIFFIISYVIRVFNAFVLFLLFFACYTVKLCKANYMSTKCGYEILKFQSDEVEDSILW